MWFRSAPQETEGQSARRRERSGETYIREGEPWGETVSRINDLSSPMGNSVIPETLPKLLPLSLPLRKLAQCLQRYTA